MLENFNTDVERNTIRLK